MDGFQIVNMEHNSLFCRLNHSICYAWVIAIKLDALALQLFTEFVKPQESCF